MDGAAEVPRGRELGASAYAGAVVGGLLGSALGAGVWAVFILKLAIYWGAIAFLVGLASGLGAFLLSGRARGTAIQAIAEACALLGYLAGKYVVTAHLHVNWLTATKGITPGLLDPQVWSYVWGNPDHHLGMFDLIWAAFAVWGAMIIPARSDRR